MSPVIAFDIAIVAKKVKVQCYIMADMLNLKKWVLVITNRSGWLLELLTELTKMNKDKDRKIERRKEEKTERPKILMPCHNMLKKSRE